MSKNSRDHLTKPFVEKTNVLEEMITKTTKELDNIASALEKKKHDLKDKGYLIDAWDIEKVSKKLEESREIFDEFSSKACADIGHHYNVVKRKSLLSDQIENETIIKLFCTN